MEYSYCPKLARKAEKLLRNAFALAGVLLLSSSFFPNVKLPWLFQLLALFAFFGVVILQSYLNRIYCYRITENYLFEIEERIGTRRQVVCRLAKSEIETILPANAPEAKVLLKERGRKHYRYLGTLFQKDSYLLAATVSGEKLRVAILADEQLLAMLSFN